MFDDHPHDHDREDEARHDPGGNFPRVVRHVECSLVRIGVAIEGLCFGGWLLVLEEIFCLLVEEMVYRRLLRAAVMFKHILIHLLARPLMGEADVSEHCRSMFLSRLKTCKQQTSFHACARHSKQIR